MEIKHILSKEMDSYAKLERTRTVHAEELSRKNAASTQSGDRATVSAAAKLRGEAFAAALSAPDTRSAKVDDLRAQVENGTYQVDSRNIAAKILEEERRILG